MLNRLAVAAVAALSALSSVGCAATVSRDQYDRDLAAQKEYIESLERQNADYAAKAKALENLEDMNLVARTQDELYQQIADQLKAALGALRHDGEETMTFDAAKGRWTMGTDLLFDSGTWNITAKGMEILKKFAEAHKGKAMRFRIVGHTDRAPIAKGPTKERLETDTNSELSCRRAIAVMGALRKFGSFSESQFEVAGMGNQQPVAPNDKNAANMKKNRRVEIYILK